MTNNLMDNIVNLEKLLKDSKQNDGQNIQKIQKIP